MDFIKRNNLTNLLSFENELKNIIANLMSKIEVPVYVNQTLLELTNYKGNDNLEIKKIKSKASRLKNIRYLLQKIYDMKKEATEKYTNRNIVKITVSGEKRIKVVFVYDQY